MRNLLRHNGQHSCRTLECELNYESLAQHNQRKSSEIGSYFDTGNTRRDKVLMFDQISPTLACVRVQLEMFGGVMQDYLNIVFIDGRWMVLAKMWERVGDSVD